MARPQCHTLGQAAPTLRNASQVLFLAFLLETSVTLVTMLWKLLQMYILHFYAFGVDFLGLSNVTKMLAPCLRSAIWFLSHYVFWVRILIGDSSAYKKDSAHSAILHATVKLWRPLQYETYFGREALGINIEYHGFISRRSALPSPGREDHIRNVYRRKQS